MCSHCQAVKVRERYRRHFGADPLDDMDRQDLWPGYVDSFIRRRPHDVGDDQAVSPASQSCALDLIGKCRSSIVVLTWVRAARLKVN